MTSSMTREKLAPLSELPAPWCLMLVLTGKNRLERVIRELAAGKEYDKIKKIIQQLCNDFAYAVHQPHARNGGLIGLAAAAIALGPVSRRISPRVRLLTPEYRI